MNNEILVETTREVWTAIYAKHRDELGVHGSYSAPCGSPFGSSHEGVMETRWGFKGASHPLIQAENRWEIVPGSIERRNETWRYWLVCAKDES